MLSLRCIFKKGADLRPVCILSDGEGVGAPFALRTNVLNCSFCCFWSRDTSSTRQVFSQQNHESRSVLCKGNTFETADYLIVYHLHHKLLIFQNERIIPKEGKFIFL